MFRTECIRNPYSGKERILYSEMNVREGRSYAGDKGHRWMDNGSIDVEKEV